MQIDLFSNPHGNTLSISDGKGFNITIVLGSASDVESLKRSARRAMKNSHNDYYCFTHKDFGLALSQEDLQKIQNL